MLVDNTKIIKYKEKSLPILLYATILIGSVFMINLFLENYAAQKKCVDFKVYQALYDTNNQAIVVWLDQNGTIPCNDLKISVHPNHVWSFDTAKPEQFIRLSFPKRLNASRDIPFFQEIFIEWKYNDNNQEIKDDMILWIIIEKHNLVF